MRRVPRILAVAALVLGLALLGSSQSQSVQAEVNSLVTKVNVNSITYNLYATDAFIELADGTVVYNYGFVGGRAGEPLVFQKSFSSNGTTGGGNDTSFTSGAPAPTGGQVNEETGEDKLQGNAQFPAPLIYAAVGDIVEIRLKNLGTTLATAPNDPHSIHLHGLDVDAGNDGVPETSVGAIPANLCSDGSTAAQGDTCGDTGKQPWPGAGNVVVYMFSAKYAGATMYHCHQEADIHVQMGMYGALVIYSADDRANPNSAYNNGGPGSNHGGTLWGWNFAKDYVLLESEMDVRQHCSEQGTYANGVCPGVDTLPGQLAAWNPVDYQPQYWFLNGISFPQTIHAAGGPVLSWAEWIAAHKGYDPFITGSVGQRDKVLIHMINMGFETQPMHMHGFHGKVIGSDQRMWPWAQTAFGMGTEKNTLTIGSGEVYEWLIDFGQVTVTSTYPPASQTRYDPATKLPVSNTVTGDPAITDLSNLPLTGTDYIGGPLVTGAQGVPTTGQLFPFHNHDDYKATNNGTYPGGMFTMIMPLP
jgi:manganese oxidase